MLLEKYIFVPKYYGISTFGIPETIKFNPTNINITFSGTLRDYQIPIIEKCMKHIELHGGGVLSVPCAYGKTTMALYMAAQRD